KDFPFGSHLFLLRFERLVIAPEDLAVGESHRELEIFSLRIAEVSEIRVELVFGTDGKIAIAFHAGILRVSIRCHGGAAKKAPDKTKANTNLHPPLDVHPAVVTGMKQ